MHVPIQNCMTCLSIVALIVLSVWIQWKYIITNEISLLKTSGTLFNTCIYVFITIEIWCMMKWTVLYVANHTNFFILSHFYFNDWWAQFASLVFRDLHMKEVMWKAILKYYYFTNPCNLFLLKLNEIYDF